MDHSMTPEEVLAVLLTAMHPRFLIRASSDQSRGINSASLISPLAGFDHMENGVYYDGFTRVSWGNSYTMLHWHILGYYEYASAFSSWSVSLLWVLVHALRKKYIKGETNVLIHALDTKRMGSARRIFRAQSLMRLFHLEDHPQHKRLNTYEYASGEYLIYGPLQREDGYTTMKLDDLVQAGLLGSFEKLNPLPRVNPSGFSTHKPRSWRNKKKRFEADARLHQRAKRVRHFYFTPRHTKPVHPRHLDRKGRYFDDSGMEIWSMSPEYVPYSRALGKCFDPSWEATMTIAFAGLRRRNVSYQEMHHLLKDLDGLPCRSIDFWSDEKVIRDDIEEHRQMLSMWLLFQESQEE